MEALLDAVTGGLAGKPLWTLHARLGAIAWTDACRGIERMAEGLLAHDTAEIRIATLATTAYLTLTARLVNEVQVPEREDCLDALFSMELAVSAATLPERVSFERVVVFFESVRG